MPLAVVRKEVRGNKLICKSNGCTGLQRSIPAMLGGAIYRDRRNETSFQILPFTHRPRLGSDNIYGLQTVPGFDAVCTDFVRRCQ